MIQEELLKKAIQNQCRNGNIKMTYGIRILDDKNKYVTVDLPDVLVEIHNGDRFYWSILDLYFIGYREESKPISISEKEIIESERGLFLCSFSMISFRICFTSLLLASSPESVAIPSEKKYLSG